MAGKTIVPKRSTSDIVEDWAKYAYQDMSDDILAKAFKDGRLLESLEYSVKRFAPEHIEVTFSYLLYGAFQDMGVNRHGRSFRPNKWYARNMAYSSGKLGEMMMKRYGSLAGIRLSEIFPDKITLG
jgi:hypothetical protein